MTQFAQAIVLGLLYGGVYALMASGLTLIFGVMNIINVAQGAFLILVAMVTWKVWEITGFDPILMSLFTAPAMFGFGWLLYRYVVVRVRGSSASMTVLLTFGIALSIEGLLNVLVGNRFRSVTPSYFNESFQLGSFDVPKVRAYGCIAALVTLGLLYVILTKTWTGWAIRASSQNPSGAALVGISTTSVAALAFALGVATAGVGGSILAVQNSFFPASHYDWIARILGIIVLGGMGSLPGALVGALTLGLAEAMTQTYGSPRWATLMFYVVIVVVLLVRPHGIFGARLREDVAT